MEKRTTRNLVISAAVHGTYLTYAKKKINIDTYTHTQKIS